MTKLASLRRAPNWNLRRFLITRLLVLTVKTDGNLVGKLLLLLPCLVSPSSLLFFFILFLESELLLLLGLVLKLLEEPLLLFFVRALSAGCLVCCLEELFLVSLGKFKDN